MERLPRPARSRLGADARGSERLAGGGQEASRTLRGLRFSFRPSRKGVFHDCRPRFPRRRVSSRFPGLGSRPSKLQGLEQVPRVHVPCDRCRAEGLEEDQVRRGSRPLHPALLGEARSGPQDAGQRVQGRLRPARQRGGSALRDAAPPRSPHRAREALCSRRPDATGEAHETAGYPSPPGDPGPRQSGSPPTAERTGNLDRRQPRHVQV